MKSKRPDLTDADYEQLADWAEKGFDPSVIRPRPGRPSISNIPGHHSPRMSTRVSPRLRDAVLARAASEGRTPSQIMRTLLEVYAGLLPDTPSTTFASPAPEPTERSTRQQPRMQTGATVETWPRRVPRS